MSTMATSRTPGRAERKASLGKSERTSGESTCEDSRTSDKSRPMNGTYIISALSKSGGTPYKGRLTLQRRSRRRTRGETTMESSLSTTPAPEKRLTLQRRTRTPSMDTSTLVQRGPSGSVPQSTAKVLSEANGRTPTLSRSASLRTTASRSKATDVETNRGHVEAQTFNTPTKKTPFERIAAKRDVFERLAQKEAPKSSKSASLDRPKPRAQQPVEDAKPVPAPRVSKAAAGVQRTPAAQQVRKTSNTFTTSTPGHKRDKSLVRASNTSTLPPAASEQPLARPSDPPGQQESFKMENSAVTVAVRVRPFNARFVIQDRS